MEWNDEIKVWNVKEQACIHAFFNLHHGSIRALFFAGGTDTACIALSGAGSINRLWRAGRAGVSKISMMNC